MDREFRYIAQIQEISRIRKDLEFLEQECAIHRAEVRQIQLIIEELFSNIVRYAFRDKNDHPVDIRLSCHDGHIEIEIIDDGIPFNPLEYQIGTLADPAGFEEGGMGLPLIRAFSSGVSYQRNSGKNHLRIIKNLKTR